MALHDLRGKIVGKPCHELLGTPARKTITPYASLQPETASFEDYRDSMIEWAQRAGEIETVARVAAPLTPAWTEQGRPERS